MTEHLQCTDHSQATWGATGPPATVAPPKLAPFLTGARMAVAPQPARLEILTRGVHTVSMSSCACWIDAQPVTRQPQLTLHDTIISTGVAIPVVFAVSFLCLCLFYRVFSTCSKHQSVSFKHVCSGCCENPATAGRGARERCYHTR